MVKPTPPTYLNSLKCLVLDCVKISHSRGLCDTHYRSITKFIKQGKYTDEDLVSRGKILKRAGRGKSVKPLTDWLNT